MADADSEATETQVWLDFACDCDYLSQETMINWHEKYLKSHSGRAFASKHFDMK